MSSWRKRTTHYRAKGLRTGWTFRWPSIVQWALSLRVRGFLHLLAFNACGNAPAFLWRSLPLLGATCPRIHHRALFLSALRRAPQRIRRRRISARPPSPNPTRARLPSDRDPAHTPGPKPPMGTAQSPTKEVGSNDFLHPVFISPCTVTPLAFESSLSSQF